MSAPGEGVDTPATGVVVTIAGGLDCAMRGTVERMERTRREQGLFISASVALARISRKGFLMTFIHQ
jgi:hypothetical protein